MKWREVVVAAALWVVLFIRLVPDTANDIRIAAFGAALAVVVFAAVKALARVLGAK